MGGCFSSDDDDWGGDRDYRHRGPNLQSDQTDSRDKNRPTNYNGPSYRGSNGQSQQSKPAEQTQQRAQLVRYTDIELVITAMKTIDHFLEKYFDVKDENPDGGRMF